MPELAEIKIAGDFFNAKAKGKKCLKIVAKVTSKVKTDLTVLAPFDIISDARGKELLFTIHDAKGVERKLLLFFGMSGFFKAINTDEEEQKARLKFYYDDNSIIGFFDGRNFSKWKWVDGWSVNRGPSPVSEFEEFKHNILDNFGCKDFNKPLHVVLLNQKYFNGIGNYLRSTIIYNLRIIDPNIPFNNLNEHELSALIESCRIIPSFFYFHHAYGLTSYNSGGKIYNKDYTKDDPIGWDKMTEFFKTYKRFHWMQKDLLLLDLITSNSPNNLMFYGVGCKKKDSTGRTFWYDCKWDNPGILKITYRIF